MTCFIFCEDTFLFLLKNTNFKNIIEKHIIHSSRIYTYVVFSRIIMSISHKKMSSKCSLLKKNTKINYLTSFRARFAVHISNYKILYFLKQIFTTLNRKFLLHMERNVKSSFLSMNTIK